MSPPSLSSRLPPNLPPNLPPSLPPDRLEGPAAWRGPELSPADWTHELAPAEVREVEAAARAMAARGVDLARIGAADFPLPTVGPRLRALLADAVLGGRGFAVIRGLDPAALSRREAAAAFLGWGRTWGRRGRRTRRAMCWGT